MLCPINPLPKPDQPKRIPMHFTSPSQPSSPTPIDPRLFVSLTLIEFKRYTLQDPPTSTSQATLQLIEAALRTTQSFFPQPHLSIYNPATPTNTSPLLQLITPFTPLLHPNPYYPTNPDDFDDPTNPDDPDDDIIEIKAGTHTPPGAEPSSGYDSSPPNFPYTREELDDLYANDPRNADL